jgi:tetratricopeptide (TPR) repeat protein
LVSNELGRRNLICVKFLSGMYREIIKNETDVPSRDGLSLMMVASAYYAIGKFEPALSVLQRAGVELSKKITTSPEHNVFCAKLFNNMGCAYFEMGKYEKAMQTYQRALQLFQNDDGCNYAAWVAAIVDQASIMNNMAVSRPIVASSSFAVTCFSLSILFVPNRPHCEVHADQVQAVR